MQPAPVKTSAMGPGPIHGILFDFCATWIPAYRASAGGRSLCACMCT